MRNSCLPRSLSRLKYCPFAQLRESGKTELLLGCFASDKFFHLWSVCFHPDTKVIMKAVFSAIALVVCVSSAADAMFVWTEDPALQASVASVSPVKVPSYTVNLDLDPKDRWTEIASSPKLRAAVPAIVDYLDSNIPSWAKPLIEKIGADIVNYFGPEYGEEMKGSVITFFICLPPLPFCVHILNKLTHIESMKRVAAAYGAPLKLGDVVALNLVMQIESIALNCSTWNVTGPTIPNDPGCMDVDPDQHWCYWLVVFSPVVVHQK